MGCERGWRRGIRWVWVNVEYLCIGGGRWGVVGMICWGVRVGLIVIYGFGIGFEGGGGRDEVEGGLGSEGNDGGGSGGRGGGDGGEKEVGDVVGEGDVWVC